MSKTAVIFGVTGQAGSYLSELLLKHGYSVTGVGRRVSVSNDERIRHLYPNPAFRVVAGDVTDATSVFRILDEVEPDEVYNLAAQSHVRVSFDEPVHTLQATGAAVVNILEWLRRLPNRRRRFYQASSSEMFGSQVDADGCQRESTPMIPNSPYAAAKLYAHNMVKLYRDSYGLHASCGILFNHESERRGELFVTRKITLHVARHVYRRRHSELVSPLALGNIHAARDWGHAEDYVRAMWLMLQQDEPDDYVVATGDVHTVEDFLRAAFAVVGESLPVYRIDESLYRPSEVPFLRGDASKARAKLGWSPTIDFQSLVKRMVLSDIGLSWGTILRSDARFIKLEQSAIP